MKKLLLVTCLILLMTPFLQAANLKISGYVLDSLTGTPIVNHAVYIYTDSSGGFFYYNTAYTDLSGYYNDTIWNVTIPSGTVFVSTYDCNSNVVQAMLTFTNPNQSLTHDFLICTVQPVSCTAEFTYSVDPGNPLLVNFTDQSTGNINSWMWNFGDGQTSTLQNPSHQYAQQGTYTVTLLVQGADSNCYGTHSENITLMVSPEPCEASFYALPDSNSVSTYSFIDQSTGNIVSWYWNFGDGQTSTLQNPVHTYSAPGWYNVCLTIQGADSLCFDTMCDTLYVAGGGGCEAGFTYIPDSLPGTYAVQFLDQSAGTPVSWYWNFGDSTISTEQNPYHIFRSEGTYHVCLTIECQGTTSTWCDDITVIDSLLYHQVYGQVFAGSFPAAAGIVLIIGTDTNQSNIPYFNFTSLDSNGVYYFTQVPDGSYLLLAIPLDSGLYLPTYYGDVLYWNEASLIILGEPVNPYNIHLVASGQLVPGPGTINGQITTSRNVASGLEQIHMLIMDETYQVIGYAPVDEAGFFHFTQIRLGTYYLHAELPGCTSDLIRVMVTEDQPVSNVQMTYSGTQILGVRDQQKMLDAGILYPNPAKDVVCIPVTFDRPTVLTTQVMDLSGRVVQYSESVIDGAGARTISFPVSSLRAGIYMLKLTSREGLSVSQKLIILK